MLLCGHELENTLIVEKLQDLFMKKYCKNKSNRVYDFMLCGKVMINHLITGLMKKILSYQLSCFPEPQNHIDKGKTKVELDLFNYTTNANLKIATVIDTSKYAEKADLAGLKSDVDKPHIDKLDINE